MLNSFASWDRVATIRKRIRNTYIPNINTDEKFFFPPNLQPVYNHPYIKALMDEEKRFFLIQSCYAYLRRIIAHESQGVCYITLKLINQDFPVNLSQDIKFKLRTVIIDEMYHSHVAEDFISQVQDTTAISPIKLFSKAPLIAAIDAACKNVKNKRIKEIFSAFAICFAENSLSDSLTKIIKDSNVHPFFTRLNLDHLADEGRHAKIFDLLFCEIISKIPKNDLESTLELIDLFLENFTNNQSQKEDDSLVLKELAFDDNAIAKIISDSYPVRSLEAVENHPEIKQIRQFVSRHVKKEAFTLIDLLNNQFNNRANASVVFIRNKHITYANLVSQSDAIARGILGLGVRKGSIIAVASDVKESFPVIFYGVLKAKAIFFPLSNHLTKDQLAEIFNSIKPSCIIAEENLDIKNIKILSLKKILAFNSEQVALPKVKATDKACLLLTSGTTGKPKGVYLNHEGLARFSMGCRENFPVTEGDRWLQFAPWGSDASLADILNTVAAGATLYSGFDNLKNSSHNFFTICSKHQITHLNLPTSFFVELVKNLDRKSFILPKSLKILLIYGESLPKNILKKWSESQTDNVSLVNTYGPTETSIGISFCHLNRYLQLALDNQLIGEPLVQDTMLVFDEDGKVLGENQIGELCIAGKSVSPGYHGIFTENDQKKFIDLNLSGKKTRAYKTGDRASWINVNGKKLFKFHGRVDRQVKVSGYKVNPEIIEQEINSFPFVQRSHVLLMHDNNNNNKLVAFVETNQASISVSKLKTEAKKNIDSYNCPKDFIILQSFPLTTRGKINEQELVRIYHKKKEFKNSHEDCFLKKIWINYLGESKINKQSNFFSLGGDSLLAIRMVAHINEKIGLQITIRDLMENARFEDFKKFIKISKEKQNILVQKRFVKNNILSIAQEVVWRQHHSLDEYKNNRADLNVTFIVQIKGELTEEILNQALTKLYDKYDGLNAIVIKNKGDLEQRRGEPHSDVAIEEDHLKVADLSSESFILGNDKKKSPLRIRLFKGSIKHQYTLIIVHHQILFDGLSFDLIVKDLGRFLTGIKQKKSLSYDKVSYLNYCQKIRSEGRAIQKASLEFWQKNLFGSKLMSLDFCYPRGVFDPNQGHIFESKITGKDFFVLKEQSQLSKTSLFSRVVAALSLQICEELNQHDFCIPTVVSTRDSEEDFKQVGMLVNTILIRVQTDKSDSVNHLSKRIQKTLIKSLQHRFTPLLAALRAANFSFDSSKPLFPLAVNFHNFGENYGKYKSDAFEISSEIFSNRTTTRFSISLEIFQRRNSLEIQYIFCPKIYSYERIKNLSEKIFRRLCV